MSQPKLAVCKRIYIRILYFDSLSRKNYRNVCHMAQILDLIILLIHQSFETIQGLLNVDSLSRENYRNVCHMAKLTVFRWIYISIQYVDSLSRKNYRNACHMAKMLYFFIAYTSIFYSILLLSHENYRNMCHSPNSLFLSTYTSIFQNNSGIV